MTTRVSQSVQHRCRQRRTKCTVTK